MTISGSGVNVSTLADMAAVTSADVDGAVLKRARLLVASLPSPASLKAAGQNPNTCNTKRAPTGPKRCTCKKSRCLKLYCECFAGGEYCGVACQCVSCMNTVEHKAQVELAKEQVLARTPGAFAPKVVVTGKAGNDGSSDGDGDELAHNRGCRCRRSHCLKKYCECFQSGVKCSKLCKCVECLNGGSNTGGGPDAAAMAAAVRAVAAAKVFATAQSLSGQTTMEYSRQISSATEDAQRLARADHRPQREQHLAVHHAVLRSVEDVVARVGVRRVPQPRERRLHSRMLLQLYALAHRRVVVELAGRAAVLQPRDLGGTRELPQRMRRAW